MEKIKNVNVATGVLNIIIVFSSLFLNIWSYGSIDYVFAYRFDGGQMSTIALFGKGMYNDGILVFSLVISFVALIVCSILNFQNKKISLAKKIQIIGSIVIAVMFALVHVGVFEFYADYSICELNAMGFVVVGLCVINVVLSAMFLAKNKE